MTCAILLAAGRSQRMGCQKLLLPFAGRTVIGHIAAALMASALDRVIVVAGRDVKEIDEAVQQATGGSGSAGSPGQRMTLVVNPDLSGDMLSSVRCGVRALPADCRTVLVALGDQPSISPNLIAQLLAGFDAAGRGILVPVYGRKSGHPILFSSRYCHEVLTGFDEVGLRGLLQAHRDDVCGFPVADAVVLCDVDYPEDYRRELARGSPGTAG